MFVIHCQAFVFERWGKGKIMENKKIENSSQLMFKAINDVNITMRAYFAAMALPGLQEEFGGRYYDADVIALKAVEQADALIRALANEA